MKCVYHPIVESEERCAICNVSICKSCVTEAELDNSGACQTCARQAKIGKFYHYFRIGSCATGIIWLIASMIIFSNETKLMTRFSYGLYGLLLSFLLNFLAAFILTRMMISNLKPHQRVFVGLSRYAISGTKIFFNQALKAMSKVDDMSQYQDALFDQIVSILILQPFDLPADWVSYLSENFKITEQELLDGILEFGIDVFYDNIFNHYHYQAIEPYIEILNRQKRDDLYNKLLDDILLRLKNVDLDVLNKPPEYIPGQPGQQPTLKKRDPKTIQNTALLSELSLIDVELGDFLKRVGREKDHQKILNFTDNFNLPAVPKSSFDAVKALARGQQSQQQTQQPQQTLQPQQTQQPMLSDSQRNLIALPPQQEELASDETVHLKTCAECGESFAKHELSSYTFEKVKVRVCNKCNKILEADGNRKPKLLANMDK